nr:ectoine synthase [Mycobacteroides abscessus]
MTRLRHAGTVDQVSTRTPLCWTQPGTETPLHYPDYIEAVWIVEGHGQLIDRDHGATHRLAPGTMYLLDKHDRHTIVADSRIRALCVFVPAVPPGSP